MDFEITPVDELEDSIITAIIDVCYVDIMKYTETDDGKLIVRCPSEAAIDALCTLIEAACERPDVKALEGDDQVREWVQAHKDEICSGRL